MTTAFCPQCKQVQGIQEYFDGPNEVIFCLVCGYQLAGDPTAAPPAPARHAKLLFIDDDKLILGLFRDFALHHGFVPRVASDGPSGIALAKREQPDLIILDVTLARMEGLEVCRRLRAEPDLQHVPILLITAVEDPTTFAKGLKAGATLTMAKILDPQRFLNTIQQLLSSTLRRASSL